MAPPRRPDFSAGLRVSSAPGSPDRALRSLAEGYDRWYFGSFGYAEYSDDPDDIEWLCDWSSPDWQTVTLTGLEETQDDFRWYQENSVWEQRTYDQSKEAALLLVMVRFLQLIRRATSSGSLAVSVPIVATAHGFDILGRF